MWEASVTKATRGPTFLHTISYLGSQSCVSRTEMENKTSDVVSELGFNFSNATSQILVYHIPEFKVTFYSIVIVVLLAVWTLTTIIGNVLVMAAVYAEKKLKTTFNCYIVNLAITDLSVGLIVLPFYSIYTILQYWPLGKCLCNSSLSHLYQMASVVSSLIS